MTAATCVKQMLLGFWHTPPAHSLVKNNLYLVLQGFVCNVKILYLDF